MIEIVCILMRSLVVYVKCYKLPFDILQLPFMLNNVSSTLYFMISRCCCYKASFLGSSEINTHIFLAFCNIWSFITALACYIMHLNKNYDLEFVLSYIKPKNTCISYSIKFLCFVFEIALKGFLK